MTTLSKYPRTLHWPTSPGVQSDDKVLKDVSHFIGKKVNITEKLDGSNTLLCNGEVYARSVQLPSSNAWHGMVRKHHSWKTTELGPDYKIFGEDLYAIHSIEYDGFRESETFRVFNILYKDEWLSFDDRTAICQKYNFKQVPVWLMGASFESEKDISNWFARNIKLGSRLGVDNEGFVIQTHGSFHKDDFTKNVAKFVREGHVQTDQHWTRNWKPCRLIHG